MAYEQRDNSGTAFRNDKKKDSHPDWRGDLMVKGGKYRISIWEKQGKKGPFLSISLEENRQENSTSPTPTGNQNSGTRPSADLPIDDDYPF